MKRLPKPGEVWTSPYGFQRTVVNVYPDAVTCTVDGVLYVDVPEAFARACRPPEPTVVDEVRFRVTNDGILMFDRDHPTHRLEALSDGTVRLVEVDR